MTLFEKIEKEFTDAFNDRVLETIKEQIPIYSKKYPFVGKITIGMGGAAVDDRDGVIMHDMNWKDHDQRNPKGDDSIFNKIKAERDAAYNDEFIYFLRDIQFSDICTVQVGEILL
jgi:hypothetical protein